MSANSARPKVVTALANLNSPTSVPPSPNRTEVPARVVISVAILSLSSNSLCFLVFKTMVPSKLALCKSSLGASTWNRRVNLPMLITSLSLSTSSLTLRLLTKVPFKLSLSMIKAVLLLNSIWACLRETPRLSKTMSLSGVRPMEMRFFSVTTRSMTLSSNLTTISGIVTLRFS